MRSPFAWTAVLLALLVLPAVVSAEPSYIYGIHDPGGESLMGNNKGWIVWTEAIGTSGSGGVDYSAYANAGYGVIVRLNNGYDSAGTIPHNSQYAAFAARCANFVQNSSGVHYWIIGNEPNLPREWPGNSGGNPTTGQPITVSRYVSCYNQCWNAIKAVAPNAKVCPAPTGTWAPPFPDQGIEGFLDYWVNVLNGIGASKIDGLILHAYTHGCDPNLVFSNQLMGPPYQTIYYHFRVYLNYMNAIPQSMKSKPVLITECNQNYECACCGTPAHAWANTNSGWVRNVYAEINAWNQSNSQKIRCVALFRWPLLPEGPYTYGWSDKAGVIQDFQQAVAFGYQWGVPPPTITRSPASLSPTTGQGGNAPSEQFTIQNTGGGTLSYSISDNVSWLSCTPTSGTSTGEVDTITVNYSTSGLAVGTYNATITITASGATNSPQTIPVTLTVTSSGMIDAMPSGTNLALSAVQVQADTEFSPNEAAAKARDGVVSAGSKWCSTNASSTHWLKYDLGSTKTVTGFVVRHAGAGGEFTYYNTQQFSIQSGTSYNGPWTDEVVVNNSAQANVTQRAYVPPKQLRYIRLHITDAGIDDYARIPEFEVYGTGGGKITVAEDFGSVPSWTSSFDAPWGGSATWSIVTPGQGGSGGALQAARAGTGSSAKVKVYNITPNQSYTIRIYMRCPSSSDAYWREMHFKLGSHSAQDYDQNAGTWTEVKKFSNTGANGNGNVWTEYTQTFNSGSNSQISVGFKSGNSSGSGPTCQWDALRIE